MAEIIPAIMPDDFMDLKEKMSLVSGVVPLVQVDVMDGKFVTRKTWPYKDVPDPDFEAILAEDIGFPQWEELDFEVDLMISRSEDVWQDWVKAGAKRIIFHIESLAEPERFLDEVRENSVSPDSIFYVEIGLAIDIDTPNEILDPVISKADFVQCMGIATIGKQGEPFDERVLEKINDLRNKYPDLIISVDGGVNLETALPLIEAGANRLVAGSAIFLSDDIRQTIEDFESVI
ncbi:MAG: hypothetical protein HQ402_00955 [Parcubacteria group bacterium]|nr:hypothetical protein [Parcubacteria group bacterium]